MALEAEQDKGAGLSLVGVGAPGLPGDHPLAEVTFTVRPGEVLAVLSGFGSGASTLLRIAGGLLPPCPGTVVLPDGGAFFLPEAPEFGLGVTVGELAGSLDLPERAFRSALERLGLHRLVDRSMQVLPAPLRARVGLAALVCSPRPVLLAEAFDEGLDVECRHAATDLLSECVEDGKILVLGAARGWVPAELQASWLGLRAGRVAGIAAGHEPRSEGITAWFDSLVAADEDEGNGSSERPKAHETGVP